MKTKTNTEQERKRIEEKILSLEKLLLEKLLFNNHFERERRFERVINGILVLIFVILSLGVFLFPLIISLITKNYWYFSLFLVSWIPALIIGKIGDILSD